MKINTNDYVIVFLYVFLLITVVIVIPPNLRYRLFGIPFIFYGIYGIIKKKILINTSWEVGKPAQLIGYFYLLSGLLFLTGLIYKLYEFFIQN